MGFKGVYFSLTCFPDDCYISGGMRRRTWRETSIAVPIISSEENSPRLYYCVPAVYSCRYCTKAFSTKSDLDKHNNIHSGSRPYKCKSCAISFSQKANLIAHLKNVVHKNTILDASSKLVFTSKSNKNYAAKPDNANKSVEYKETKLGSGPAERNANRSNDSYADADRIKTEEEQAFVDLLNL